MGDQADIWNMIKAERKEKRARLGINCPTCTVNLPKAHPSILLPEQKCKVCGYRDPRKREQ